jgi:flavin-dependent dehydrogenase
LRQYWEGVTGFDEGDPIELHFYKNTLPGYFWIFPMANNKANVGIGIKSDVISKKKINIKLIMDDLIKNHPLVAPRFKNAKPLEEPKGFGLPLGSKRIRISGNRFILLGDAASLIDPFTGEGIGNAMVSGRIAAEHIEKCLTENNFGYIFNQQYDNAIYKKLGGELQTSYRLQKMLNKPWLFNWIVNKSNKNKHLHSFLEDMLDDPNQRDQITKPSFYYKLLFNPKK